MTQKELSYVEDAIGHEENIIKICTDTLERLEDNDLVDFIHKNVEKHNEIKENLLCLLEENSDE